ncbi:hypothetical protein H257_16137 [Aphanomyces astaci]|uniref:PX domain-containing protein n=1 Tax=Aphanomyces astaci TaxID=112090 RepID=W4FJU2_APHAT|nr:hypothetical protein H257_16137 [Aphanomyces astaci]ETV67782.1 hypothetical protein H257_16137 [Aphanomyces astaci]|eukprot:XP_009842775.1 hypothetical protein H257_16137 [Aphanomyces astaci]
MAIKHLPTPARLASIPYLATSDSTELVRASKVCQPTLFTNRVFTVYLISVSDHANHRWWTIRKRYTDFYRLRKALIAVPMSGGCHTGAIQSLLQLPFPKKHLTSSTNARVASSCGHTTSWTCSFE